MNNGKKVFSVLYFVNSCKFAVSVWGKENIYNGRRLFGL